MKFIATKFEEGKAVCLHVQEDEFEVTFFVFHPLVQSRDSATVPRDTYWLVSSHTMHITEYRNSGNFRSRYFCIGNFHGF